MVLPNGRLLHKTPKLVEFFLCCGVTDIYPEELFVGQTALKRVSISGPNNIKRLAPNMFADCGELQARAERAVELNQGAGNVLSFVGFIPAYAYSCMPRPTRGASYRTPGLRWP